MDGELGRTRRVPVFAWDNVDGDLLRALLMAASRFADSDEVANLDVWDRPQLVAVASRIFGSLPPAKFEQPFVAVLVEVWLPVAKDEVLNRLAHLVNSTHPASKRTAELPSTRTERLRLVQQGLGRNVVRTALRKEFLRAHRHHVTRTIQESREGIAAQPLELVGEGLDLLRPYDHQREAWRELDDAFAAGVSGAMLVLPTGAGKTVTALDWVFRKMEHDPELRVLWIVNQQALADQTLREAGQIVRQRQPKFRRRARAVHSAGSERGVLTDDRTAFVAITFQTLARVHKRTLGSYFKRPVFVIVDEAHHAGAGTYAKALDRIAGFATCQGFLGLSATPQPIEPLAARAVLERFPTRAYEVTLSSLIEQGILARPHFHTVRTHQVPVHDDAEREDVRRRREIPTEMLLFLARKADRNQAIVDEYLHDAPRWGKTIIFCVDIPMAEAIATALQQRDVQARAIHSGPTSGPRGATLDWFRTADELRQAGIDGHLEARILSWGEERCLSYGCSEEVQRRVA